MAEDLVTRLLPVLSRSLEAEFNVFDVMRHGRHEKQLSNVFGWLLEAGGTHRLGDAFVRIFVDEVNRALAGATVFPVEAPYLVRQEVDTSVSGVADIADLVLENNAARIVVENYYTSDGHGHSYDGYRAFGGRDGRASVVVLLCRDEDKGLLVDGWEDAVVLTYGTLLERLRREVGEDYAREHPEQHAFIDQMYRKYVKGRGRMDDGAVLDFVVAMCATGEAERYGRRPIGVAGEEFATDLAQQARERFTESRELLQAVKGRLRAFAVKVLVPQLNQALGQAVFDDATARFQGGYEWTVNLGISEVAHPEGWRGMSGGYALQIKFGPSAWLANEGEPRWTEAVDPGFVDYSRPLITNGERGVVRQSSVRMQEVLDGLGPDDVRLRDEFLSLLNEGGAR
ncbi:PD-(D/E)XK nuclease family protein [Xylanimonas allomyrinae]|nr:PD-(D/E)XK nuclease family protein [Xylanimonas allomyrinae]